jgi:outer membrane lipoprotein-sorting protein
MKPSFLFASLTLCAFALSFSRPASAITQSETDAIVKEIDYRQHTMGDYKSHVYIERKERDKNDTIFEAVIYRRGESNKLVILFEKPKDQAGQGYLRVDKNLFMYDPTVGKWERRTERERIAGTDTRRNDFDESRYSEEFTAAWVSEEKLGKYAVNRIKLSVKPGFDVAYPIVELWVDKDTGNILKRQESALSGRLMLTTYYPKWDRVFSKSKGSDVYVPEQIRVFDEVEKGNQTTVVLKEVSLDPQDDSIFTKAWIEGRSR